MIFIKISNMKYYLAGPFFNETQLNKIKEIEKSLELLEYSYLSPRDLGINPLNLNTTLDKALGLKKVLDSNIDSLNESEYAIFELSIDKKISIPDIGTLFELGYWLGKSLNGDPISSMQKFKRSTILLNADNALLESLKILFNLNYEVDNSCRRISIIDKEVISDRLVETEILPTLAVFIIDDRPLLIYLLMGLFYYLNIPFITASRKNYGSNIMISESSLSHILIPETVNDDELLTFINSYIDKELWYDFYKNFDIENNLTID